MKNELVHSKKEDIFCDSRIVAEKFGKQHPHVTQKIEKLITEINLLDSENLTAQNNKSTERFIQKTHSYRGQNFKYYEMNRQAFSLVVMGFTGRKALIWRRKFNDAFYSLERFILQKGNLEWQKEREQGKQIRLEFTDEIKTFIDYATDQGSTQASKYYITLTKLQYKALGLIEKNEKIDKQFRNTLDVMELSSLLSAERVARKALIDGIEQGLHYKDIYQLAKQRVFQLADIMVIPQIKKLK